MKKSYFKKLNYLLIGIILFNISLSLIFGILSLEMVEIMSSLVVVLVGSALIYFLYEENIWAYGLIAVFTAAFSLPLVFQVKNLAQALRVSISFIILALTIILLASKIKS